MNPDEALNATCRDIFALIVDVLSRTQDDYELTD